MRKIILYTVLTLWSFTAFSQAEEGLSKERYSGKGIIYDQEISFDLSKMTKGYNFGMNFGKLKTFYLTRYFGFNLAEFKHHKEYKLSLNNTGGLTESVFFGKQNNFYGLRAYVGEKRYFSEKSKVKGVAVGINYSLGFNLGMTKPYYVLIRSFDQEPEAIKYSESTAEEFLNTSLMRGAAPWTEGLTELGFYPGATAKVAVHVDWGAFDEYLKAVEAGISLDVFPQNIPVMVPTEGTENRKYFINLFLTLQLGKRT